MISNYANSGDQKRGGRGGTGHLFFCLYRGMRFRLNAGAFLNHIDFETLSKQLAKMGVVAEIS